VREAGLRAGGSSASWLGVSYMKNRLGSTVGAEIGHAQHYGAWTDATRWEPGGTLWDLGDGVVIGPPDARSPGLWAIGQFNGSHILTGLQIDEDTGGPLARSVDGGQFSPVDVAIRTRRVVECCGELWLADPAAGLRYDGRPEKGRRVVGWSRVGELPVR
jgi:hypothetical protein